jgi:hypothetical protein
MATAKTLNTKVYLRNTAICAGAAIAAVAVYALRSSAATWVRATGLAIVTGLAAFWLVGIIGFLFGIPRAAKDDETTNQSLEDISDWLTKIIIGASLVELRAIGSLVSDVGESLGTSVALPAGPQLFTALIVATGAAGFVFFYFWAYMYWERLRSEARPSTRRLREIEELSQAGLLTDSERENKRRNVIDDL